MPQNGSNASEDSKRAVNFNEDDLSVLLDNVELLKTRIIGTPKARPSRKHQTAAWVEIAMKLNACCSTPRTWEQCRKKYSDLTRAAKAKRNHNAHQLMLTGGGTAIMKILTDHEQRLLELIRYVEDGPLTHLDFGSMDSRAADLDASSSQEVAGPSTSHTRDDPLDASVVNSEDSYQESSVLESQQQEMEGESGVDSVNGAVPTLNDLGTWGGSNESYVASVNSASSESLHAPADAPGFILNLTPVSAEPVEPSVAAEAAEPVDDSAAAGPSRLTHSTPAGKKARKEKHADVLAPPATKVSAVSQHVMSRLETLADINTAMSAAEANQQNSIAGIASAALGQQETLAQTLIPIEQHMRSSAESLAAILGVLQRFLQGYEQAFAQGRRSTEALEALLSVQQQLLQRREQAGVPADALLATAAGNASLANLAVSEPVAEQSEEGDNDSAAAVQIKKTLGTRSRGRGRKGGR